MACGQGADLLKHGRAGRPKVHFFRLADADGQLAWRSSRGQLRCIRLCAVQRVRMAVQGQKDAGCQEMQQGWLCRV